MFHNSKYNLCIYMIDSVINNLSISAWNVQGLGDKCNVDNFSSNIKYDILGSIEGH